ncbi:hypothetical protein GCM10010302_42080 [Streptomyces polychromogenes]|uniref:Uncharacterized protein n=1 Tax=Streptomyces polychromogenes TaxID=67342 RepID=A0ABN0VGL2_9ACTN
MGPRLPENRPGGRRLTRDGAARSRLRLAADGALVAVRYGGNEAAAAETVARITDAGGRAFGVRPLRRERRAGPAVRGSHGPPADTAVVNGGVGAGLRHHLGAHQNRVQDAAGLHAAANRTPVHGCPEPARARCSPTWRA